MGKQILIAQLKKEGFLIVYEWHDEPGTIYESHSHKGAVSFYVTKGSVHFEFADGKKVSVKEGDRMNVPIGVAHTAIVGEEGCDYIVGQMIEGDA
jgi:quercetin dioxygenase-like cupin family protein